MIETLRALHQAYREGKVAYYDFIKWRNNLEKRVRDKYTPLVKTLTDIIGSNPKIRYTEAFQRFSGAQKLGNGSSRSPIKRPPSSPGDRSESTPKKRKTNPDNHGTSGDPGTNKIVPLPMKPNTSIPNTLCCFDAGTLNVDAKPFKHITSMETYAEGQLVSDFWRINASRQNKSCWVSGAGRQIVTSSLDGLPMSFQDSGASSQTFNSVAKLRRIQELNNLPSPDYSGGEYGPTNNNGSQRATILTDQYVIYHFKNISPTPTPIHLTIYTAEILEDIHCVSLDLSDDAAIQNAAGQSNLGPKANPFLANLVNSFRQQTETGASSVGYISTAQGDNRWPDTGSGVIKTDQQFTAPWYFNLGHADLTSFIRVVDKKKIVIPDGVTAQIRMGISKPQYHNYDHLLRANDVHVGDAAALGFTHYPVAHKKGETVTFYKFYGGVAGGASTGETSTTKAFIEESVLATLVQQGFKYRVIPRTSTGDSFSTINKLSTADLTVDVDLQHAN